METYAKITITMLLALIFSMQSLKCEEKLENLLNKIQGTVLRSKPSQSAKLPDYAKGYYVANLKLKGLTPNTKYINKVTHLCAKKHLCEMTGNGADPELLQLLKNMSVSKDSWQTEDWTVSDLLFKSKGVMPGVVIEVKIYSENNDLLYQDTFIPHPLIADSPSGQLQIECELKSFLGNTLYQIHIDGMKKDESYHFSSKSYDEVVSFPIPSNQDQILYSPNVIGKTHGLAKITISSSTEKVYFTLPWGKELTDYLQGNHYYTPSGPHKVIRASE